MRFMMLMIPKGDEKAAPGAMPDAKAVAAMMKYNESLQKAGVLSVEDFSDFPADVKKAAAGFPEMQPQSDKHRRA
jgi:hypothetical protein